MTLSDPPDDVSSAPSPLELEVEVLRQVNRDLREALERLDGDRLPEGADPAAETAIAPAITVADVATAIGPAVGIGSGPPLLSPTLDAPDEPNTQKSLAGRYAVGRLVGKGGMGRVYEAWDDRLGKRVALKALRSAEAADEEEVARFRNEAASIAKLSHANIVPVLDTGSEKGLEYIVMDFIDGVPFGVWLRQRQRSYKERVRMLAIISRAIQHAHERGVLHRDLKPGNIMVDEAGVPFVLDFGLARSIGSSDGLTRTGQAVGTPAYMAPEQARGKGNLIGAHSDVWSLGILLYESIAGRPPFQAETAYDVMVAVVHQEPPPLRRFDTKAPRELGAVIGKCLEKAANLRYQSAADLADDLERYLDGKPVRARRRSVIELGMRRLAKHRIPIGFGFATVLMGILLALWLTEEQYRRAQPWVADGGFVAVAGQPAGILQLDPLTFQTAGGIAIDERGLVLAPRPGHQPWFALDTPFRGHLRIESVVSLEENDQVELALVPDFQRPQAEWHLPPGIICRFGVDGRYAAVQRQQESAAPHQRQLFDMPRLGPGTHRLVVERSHTSLSLRMDDRVIGTIDWALPQSGADSVRVLIRAKRASTRLRAMHVVRRASAVETSPVATADVLWANGLTTQALEAYMRLADDHRGNEVGEVALARAILAAGSIGDERAAVLEQAFVDAYPDSLSLAGLHRSQVVRAWRAGAFDQALERLEALPALRRELVDLVLAEERQPLTADKGRRLLILAAADADRRRLDLRGLGLVDLAPLAGLRLRDLRVDENLLTDLEPLRGMRLASLTVNGNRIDDLSPLAHMPLRRLQAAENRISAVGPLAHTVVTELDLSGNAISDVSALGNLPLRRLDISRNQLTTLDGLWSLAALEELVIHDNMVGDLNGISALERLRHLDLSGTDIDDLSPLAGLELEHLDLSRTAVSELGVTAGMTGLRILDCSQSAVRDLSPLAGDQLEELRIAHTAVSELGPLSGFSLRRIDLTASAVREVEPLRGMALEELAMAHTAVATLAPLGRAPLHTVDIRHSQVTDISPLSTASLDRLSLGGQALQGIGAVLDQPPWLLSLGAEAMTPELLQLCENRWSGDPRYHWQARQLAFSRALSQRDSTAIAALAEERAGWRFVVLHHPMAWAQAQEVAAELGAEIAQVRDHGDVQLLQRLARGAECWITVGPVQVSDPLRSDEAPDWLSLRLSGQPKGPVVVSAAGVETELNPRAERAFALVFRSEEADQQD
jgi:Leucine-rich repeat (LRR) protein/tRNA A-37 threonylcarbamoyl transferase component Bud32